MTYSPSFCCHPFLPASQAVNCSLAQGFDAGASASLDIDYRCLVGNKADTMRRAI